jgi:hypothetical protein
MSFNQKMGLDMISGLLVTFGSMMILMGIVIFALFGSMTSLWLHQKLLGMILFGISLFSAGYVVRFRSWNQKTRLARKEAT